MFRLGHDWKNWYDHKWLQGKFWDSNKPGTFLGGA